MSLSGIRASVEISHPVIGVKFLLPLADIKWITVTFDAEIDFRGLNRFPKEFQFVTDTTTLSFTKGRTDVVGASDDYTLIVVKKSSIELVDTEETRTVNYSKPLADMVDATDDFMGEANLDDDQIMLFGKTASTEHLQTADSAHLLTVKQLTEGSTTLDQHKVNFDKNTNELASTSHICNLINTKLLVEEASLIDKQISYVNKYLAEVVNATDDFYGTANADDEQSMSFVTSRSEIATVSENASLNAGKGLTETVSKSDSGSFRMTSYCDVRYFTSDYAGISSTF